MRFYLDSEIVNRFSGATVSENLPPGFSKSNSIIDINVATSIVAVDYYVVKNAIVNLNNQVILDADGVHLSFYNCILNVDVPESSPLGLTGWGGFSAGQGNSGTILAGVPGNEAISRTINYYGCTMYLHMSPRRNYYTTDFYDSNLFIYTGQMFNYLRNGSRIVRSNPTNTGGASTNWELSAVGGDLTALQFEQNRLANVIFFNFGQGDVSLVGLEVVSNGTPIIYAVGAGSGEIPNILSISPITKITTTGQVRYDQSGNANVQSARIIESMQINPVFAEDSAGITKKEGVRVQAQIEYTFTGTKYDEYNSTPSTLDYETDSNGELILQGTPTIAFGEVYPVVMTRTAQWQSGNLLSLLTDYDNLVVARNYNFDLVIGGTVVQEAVLTVDKDADYALFEDDDIIVMTPHPYIFKTEAQAALITGITITKGSKLIEISSDHITDDVFAYIRYFMYQFVNFDTPAFYLYDGTVLDVEDWDITLSSAQTSGLNFKSTGTVLVNGIQTLTDLTVDGTVDFNTTGTYTLSGCTIEEVTNSSGGAVTLLLQGGTAITTNTGPNITLLQTVPVTNVNLLDTTRVQLYNITKDAELDNSVVTGGGGYSFDADLADASVDDGDVLRIRGTQTSGVTAQEVYEESGIVTTTGLTFIGIQTTDVIYGTWGLDGSTITKFAADYVGLDVDIVVGSNYELAELGAWWAYNLTTEEGIREFFGGMEFIDEANILIHNAVVDIALDNTTATNVHQTDNRRLYRDDLTRPVKDPTTGGGGVDVEWRSPVIIANSDTIQTDLTNIYVDTQRVDGLIEDVGGDRYTEKALEQAPSGVGVGDWTSGEKENIRQALGVDGTKTAGSVAGDVQNLLTGQTDIYADTQRVDGLIENSAGDRYTAKALEEAPAGGGGGDATEANQLAIIATLGTPYDLEDGSTTTDVTAMLSQMGEKVANGATYDRSLNSLEALGEKLDNVGIVGTAINAAADTITVTTGNIVAGIVDNTKTLDGVYQQIEDTAGTLDVYYEFNIGGTGIPVNGIWTGRLNGVNDNLIIEAYDWDGTAFNQVGSIDGVNTASDSTIPFTLFPDHVGTGANIGLIRIRFSGTGLTSADLFTDQLFVSFAAINQSVGYALGAVWVDTVNGSAGTESFVNGTADNPALTWDDAQTIASNIGLVRYSFTPNSTITLDQATEGKVLFGNGYSVVLNGQSISGTEFRGAASISGVGTGVFPPTFFSCGIGTVTLPPSAGFECGFFGTFTIGSEGIFTWGGSATVLPNGTSAIIDFGAALNASDFNIHSWGGGHIELQNSGAGTGAYTFNMAGTGHLLVNVNCSANTLITLSGTIDLTDNATGISYDRAAQTIPGTIDTELSSNHGAGSWLTGGDATEANQLTILANQASMETKIDDIPNTAEFEARTLLASVYANLSNQTSIEGKIDLLPTTTEFEARTLLASFYATLSNQTNIESKLDTANTNIDAILVDTSTTLPALITALNDLSAADVWAFATRTLTANTNLNDLTEAQVKAQMVEVIRTDTTGEPGQETPPETTNLQKKIDYLYKFAINRMTQDSTTKQVFNNAGTVVDQKSTVDFTDPLFTDGKFISGP